MPVSRKLPVQYNKCPTCGKDCGFSSNGRYIKLSCPRKFCSLHCSLKFRNRSKVVYSICPFCKKEFRKYPDGVKRKYCSMECYNKVRVNHLPRYEYPIKEKKYYQIKKIKGKTVYKHRWVMEQHIGRKLERKEVVHHINGDRHDNRVENLMVMTQSEYIKLENSQLKKL